MPSTPEQKAKAADAKRRWYAENRELAKARVGKWQGANPEKVLAAGRRRYHRRKEEYTLWKAEWREANPEGDRRAAFFRRFGITWEQRDALFAGQGFACAVCGSETSKNKTGHWHTDHSHVTGKVRGVLCHRCNVAIGMANEDPSILDLLAQYVRHHTR